MLIVFLDPLDPGLAGYPERSLGGHETIVATEQGTLPTGIERAEVIFWGAYPVDSALLERLQRLRLVQRIGLLRSQGDARAALRRGVAGSAMPWANSERTAQHALALMAAALLRANGQSYGHGLHPEDIPALERSDDMPRWLGPSETELLRGKTVGILGFGEVGACLARLLAPLDCRVLYLKRNRLRDAQERYFAVEFGMLETLLRESHVFVNLMPYKGENPKLLGQRELELMQPKSVFLSIGRANVVEDDAIAEALRTGRPGAVGFDDYGPAHLSAKSPLRSTEQVIVTPQTRGGILGWVDVFERLAENLRRLDNGEPLLYPMVASDPVPGQGQR